MRKYFIIYVLFGGMTVKKCLICLLVVVFLTGCAAEQTMETISDELMKPVMAPVGKVELSLPESAWVQSMQGSNEDKLYFCNGYTVAVQTMHRGDLVETVQALSGFLPESLEIMETVSHGNKRWDWAWTCAGEGGDMICRAAVIDDGNYHYCVTVMASAASAGQLETEWNSLLESFAVGQY
jgi:hypothetical protein